MKFQRITLVVVGALMLGGLRLSGQQSTSSNHWVGIWTTADTWRPPATAVPPGTPPLVPQTPPPATAPSTPPAPPAGQPAAGRGAPPPAPVQFNGQTLRQIVHTTFGGERLRVVFSNAFGTAPIPVGGAGIALRDKDSAIVAGSARPLTFGGQPATTIPAGAVMLTDVVNLSAEPMN